MPKTLESRSLSAPPSYSLSPKSIDRTPHPLSKQAYAASDLPTPTPQPKSLKHSWRRQWSKDPHLKRTELPEMHVILDARMSLASFQIAASSDKQSSAPSNPPTPETVDPRPTAPEATID